MNKKKGSIVRRNTTPKNTGVPLSTPLSASVMYHYRSIQEVKDFNDKKNEGFSYSRYGHPNASILAEKISWLENAKGGFITASGMSALSCVFLALLEKGDTIAASRQLYGQSLKMLTKMLPRMGFETTFFDSYDASTFTEAITAKTKIILVEVESNPLLRITDFDNLVQVAKKSSALLLIDNTLTTPLGFQPLEHGADLVMHSVSKLLSGHGDLNLGYIGANNSEILEKIYDIIAVFGLNSNPFNCWQAERGLHTFDLRFKQAQKNAYKLAHILEQHPKISKIYYPGLKSHSEHELAKKMLNKNFGTIISISLKGYEQNVNNFINAAKNIPYGSTFGDVATLIVVPSLSSHRHLSKKERLKLGIEDTLIRISVGIESFDLIKDDILEALDKS